ncbi:hypothetical protein VTI74DRAFT_7033 [Chaetomium olivicolor]
MLIVKVRASNSTIFFSLEPRKIYSHTHKSCPPLALANHFRIPLPAHFFFLFPQTIPHSELPRSALLNRDTLSRGRSLGLFCLRLSVDGTRGFCIWAAAKHFVAIAGQQQRCTDICPQRPSFPVLSSAIDLPTFAACPLRDDVTSAVLSTSKDHLAALTKFKWVLPNLVPRVQPTRIRSVGETTRVVESIERPNQPTFAAQSRPELAPVSLALGAFSISPVRGGCVGLSGHRLTLARHIEQVWQE